LAADEVAERQRIMLRLADLVEEHYEELAMLDTLDLGAPVSRTSGQDAGGRCCAIMRVRRR
jgi:acyl-CoA reductase-like NAD-dependent aldehyde dehydrogenase